MKLIGIGILVTALGLVLPAGDAIGDGLSDGRDEGRRVYALFDAGPAGGLVFFDKGNWSDGWRYLEAAAGDQGSSVSWFAAKLAANPGIGGCDDWFLPSKDELDLMFENLKQTGRGGFAAGWYWSSSEHDYGSAWGRNFDEGGRGRESKYSYGNVRVIRAF